MVAEMLESHGAENYIVEIGGEIRCRGVNPKGNVWRVGIDTPEEGNMSPGHNLAATVELREKALATSGNYRRFYIDAEGRKVVHTIDPESGRSTTSSLLSATVVTSDCASADALATMFMVVGKERAIELAKRMRDSVKVYFIIDAEGDKYDIFNTLE
jgi:thiamine biosynthesis lipoprotein